MLHIFCQWRGIVAQNCIWGGGDLTMDLCSLHMHVPCIPTSL